MRFRGDGRARAGRVPVIALLLAGATVACTKSGGQPTDDGLDKVLRRHRAGAVGRGRPASSS